MPTKLMLLEVGAVVAGGFEAVEGELRGDVFGGEFAAAQAGVAAFEQVVGEELVVGADAPPRRRRADGRSGLPWCRAGGAEL
jgi:hypothetical protein